MVSLLPILTILEPTVVLLGRPLNKRCLTLELTISINYQSYFKIFLYSTDISIIKEIKEN